MAQKAKSAGKKSSGGTKSGARKKTPAASNSKAASRPVRREVGGFVCLFLGLFSFIGYFNVNALFIDLFCGFVKALIGWGYYIFPIALLYCAFVLLFHHGRPVALRVTCTMLLPLLLGALLHVLLSRVDVDFAAKWAKALYDGGKAMKCGGFLAGLLGLGLEATFSIYGAVPVLLFAFLGLMMMSANLTVAKISAYFKDRPRAEYEPEPEPEVTFDRVPQKELAQPKAPRSTAAVSGGMKECSRFLMVCALAAIGLNTDFRDLRRAGIAPMVHGFLISALVVLVALAVEACMGLL